MDTLATDAYPVTHGITCYNRKGANIDKVEYNITVVTVKQSNSGMFLLKTVKKHWYGHWPGSSWPPSSDSPNLSVVDGLTPACVNILNTTDTESVLIANEDIKETSIHPRAAADGNIPCVIEKLEDRGGTISGINGTSDQCLILQPEDGEHALSDTPFDVILAPIKAPQNWQFEIPADAKETEFLFSGGFVRRPVLILKGKSGVYDHVAIYLNKKTSEPLAILEKDVFYKNYVDDNYKEDGSVVKSNRHMRIIELKEDGSYLKVWRSFSLDTTANNTWSPTSLQKTVFENVGYAQPMSIVGGGDRTLIEKCMIPAWEEVGQWYADSINYLIDQENYEIIFSHYHNIDIQGHMIVKFLKDHGHNKLSEETYEDFMRKIYAQTDRYIARYLPLLDKGWTLFVVSDHAQVASENEPLMIGDTTGYKCSSNAGTWFM